MTDSLVFTIGLILALAGFAIGILAVIFAILRFTRGTGQARGAGVVMIGPIPIVFGTDKESAKILMLLAIVLMVMFFAFTFLTTLWR